MVALWLLIEHVREANSDESADDEDHAEPFEPGEARSQEDGGEDASEYDHSTAQHLRWGCVDVEMMDEDGNKAPGMMKHM